ncbi:hypothetical protein ACSBR2_030707 [Camellia fascicularis]
MIRDKQHLIHDIPNNSTPMQVHCHSRDNDLRTYTLRYGKIFRWKFNPNFVGITPFFCHFYWGAKNKSFTVYDHKIWLYYDTTNTPYDY